MALSCGGLVWEQVQAGNQVSIWTICAGDVPGGPLSSLAQSLHERWDTDINTPSQRKMEDHRSCHRLGVATRYFSLPDCIYRRHPHTGEHLYTSSPDLNGPLHPGEAPLTTSLRADLQQHLQEDMLIVSPLSLGNHVDHQLTRLALEDLDIPLWYYQDFPYVLAEAGTLEQLQAEGWVAHIFPVSPQGLAAWQDSIAAHASQISTFWASEEGMRQSIAHYLGWYDGIRLWTRPAR